MGILDQIEKPVRIVSIITGLIIGAIITPVAWHFTFREAIAKQINDVKLDLKENYLKKQELMPEVKSINSELKNISNRLSNIEGRLSNH